MNGKLLLMTVAVIAIGIIAMPSTISLFSGQHYWYNISSKGYNQIPCEKCHADVYEEMRNTGAHVRMRDACELCHRTCFNMTYNASSGKYEPSKGFTYARGYGVGSTPGNQAHAASTIECMDCHSIYKDGGNWNHYAYQEYESPQCDLCHWSGGYPDFISAGGFGFGTTDDDNPDKNPDAGRHAAHKQFVLDSINNTLMKGSNEACIACHTGIPVNITWTHAMSLEFNAFYDRVLPPTHFNTSDYKANGTVVVVSYGNWSGGANVRDWPEGNITIWG